MATTTMEKFLPGPPPFEELTPYGKERRKQMEKGYGRYVTLAKFPSQTEGESYSLVWDELKWELRKTRTTSTRTARFAS